MTKNEWVGYDTFCKLTHFATVMRMYSLSLNMQVSIVVKAEAESSVNTVNHNVGLPASWASSVGGCLRPMKSQTGRVCFSNFTY